MADDSYLLSKNNGPVQAEPRC